MQLILRPIAPRETDPELMWLAVSLGGLALAATWMSLGLPWPVCLFHQLTGHPCATCGATRSAIAFLHGHFLAAIAWNPLAFLAYCGIAIFDAYALAAVVMRRPRLRVVAVTQRAKRFVRWTVISALALNWMYLLFASSSV